MSVPDLYTPYKLTQNIAHDVYPAIAPNRPDLAVTGQNILISGGGSGLGLATAKAFAIAGAKTIVITGRRENALNDAAKEIKATNSNTSVVTIIADVASKAAVDALWTKIASEVGKIDVLVNNAGVSADRVVLGGGHVEEWWNVQQINIFGTYIMIDSYIASLAALNNAQGTIINLSSAISIFEFPGSSSYAVSKIAVAKLTQAVNVESPNVRIFSVHPGVVATDMGKVFGPAAKDTVELAGAFNLYLASPRADFLRGRWVTANWDVEELEANKEKIAKENLLTIGLKAELGPEGQHW